MDTLSLMIILLPLIWPRLLGGLLFQVIPDLTRPGLFFGVTVDPQFRMSKRAREIRRRYSVWIWMATLIAIAVALTAAFAAAGAGSTPTEEFAALVTHPGLQRALTAFQAVIALVAFVRANREIRPHAVSRASVVQVELSTRPPATTAVFAVLAVPIASLSVLAVWAATHWRDLPSHLAVHWAFPEAERWAATTAFNVIMLFARHTAICLVLVLITWGVLHGSRRIATAGEAAVRERRFRVRNVSLLIAVEYFSVFPVWAALLGLPSAAMTLWSLSFSATILVLLARLLLAGQGGTRDLRPGEGAAGDRTDDRNWSGGVWYFNRTDPAFLVEKRFGVGYTLNFAHPFAWALLALVAAMPLIAGML